MKNISVCIITKNECEKLERLIKSIVPYELEIVVVDTGSSDNTIDVIKKYNCVIGHYQWDNSFSNARNYSISLAQNPWILVLDSDEYIKELDITGITAFVENKEEYIGKIAINNILDDENSSKEYVGRFFNKNNYCYRGSVHEQLVSTTNGVEAKYTDIGIEINHDGYFLNEEEKQKKAHRNIELLLKELEKTPDDVYLLYQIGKSFFMSKDYEKACYYFEAALMYDVNPDYVYVQNLIESYGYTLLNLKRYSDMMFMEAVYDVFSKSADFVFLMGLAYMNNQRFDDAISEFNKATTYKSCTVSGCNSYKALYNAGVICECLGRTKEAYEYYNKSREYELSKAGLLRLKKI